MTSLLCLFSILVKNSTETRVLFFPIPIFQYLFTNPNRPHHFIFMQIPLSQSHLHCSFEIGFSWFQALQTLLSCPGHAASRTRVQSIPPTPATDLCRKISLVFCILLLILVRSASIAASAFSSWFVWRIDVSERRRCSCWCWWCFFLYWIRVHHLALVFFWNPPYTFVSSAFFFPGFIYIVGVFNCRLCKTRSFSLHFDVLNLTGMRFWCVDWIEWGSEVAEVLKVFCIC